MCVCVCVCVCQMERAASEKAVLAAVQEQKEKTDKLIEEIKVHKYTCMYTHNTSYCTITLYNTNFSKLLVNNFLAGIKLVFTVYKILLA